MNAERWVILAALFAARTAIAFQFQTVGGLAPILVGELALDYSGIGTLIGLYLLPGVPLAIPGGLLGQRYGAKTVLLAGLVLMGFGGWATGATSSFYLIAIGRVISGAGAVLINVMATKMVADWFTDQKLPTAMAVLVASWPLGIGLGVVVDHGIAAESGWPVVMYLAAAMSIASFLLVFAVYRDPPRKSLQVAQNLKPHLTRSELINVLLTGGVWATYNVGYIVLISFAPEFFTSRGYSLAYSNWIVSSLGWLLMPMIAVGGLVSEKTGRPVLFIALGLTATILAAAALPFVSSPAAHFVLIALVAGLPAGPIMALPATILRVENRAAGMGIFFACYYVAMAVLPAMAGKLRDLTGSPVTPIFFAVGTIVCALLFLIAFQMFRQPSKKPTQGRFA